jgi:hypothetical protein
MAARALGGGPQGALQDHVAAETSADHAQHRAGRRDPAAQLQRLWRQVEQGDADHRPGRESEDQRQLAAQPQRQRAAEQGRKSGGDADGGQENEAGDGTRLRCEAEGL